jgi:hypothetical protein
MSKKKVYLPPPVEELKIEIEKLVMGLSIKLIGEAFNIRDGTLAIKLNPRK